MPNIQDYTADIGGLRPNEAGQDAMVQGARRINAFTSQTAEGERREGNELGGDIKEAGDIAIKYIDSQQIDHGELQFASIQASLAQHWDQTLKQPGAATDPAIADNFRKNVVEPTIENFSKGFSTEKGQAWAEARVNALREHYFTKTAADQSSLAGLAVQQTVRQISNTYSNMASADPASLDYYLKQSDTALSGIVGHSPTLSAEDGAKVSGEVGQKMKEGIVKAALVSAINTNPEAGLKLAQDPKYAAYVNGAEANQMFTEAKRNQRVDQDTAQRLQKEQLEEKSSGNLTQVIKNLYDPAAKTKITAAQIAQLPDNVMRPSDREHAIKMIDAELKPAAEAKVSALNSDEILKGIRTQAVTSTDAIYQAKEDGKINRPDFEFLMKQYRDFNDGDGNSLSKKRAGFINTFKGQIDTSNEFTGHVDQYGKQHLWEFEQDLDRKEAALRAAGKDPHSLYDPRSPDYMGSTAALAPYKKTFQEEQAAFTDNIKRLGGDVAPAPPTPPPTVKTRAEVDKLPSSVRTFLDAKGQERFNPGYKP